MTRAPPARISFGGQFTARPLFWCGESVAGAARLRARPTTIPPMPVIACPDCGRDVSTLAPACPHCGRPSPGGMSVPLAAPAAVHDDTQWRGKPASTVLTVE